ncbi:Fumarylacetoacetate hydrolase domain-containing protein [Heterostelium album PN500]|uniref:Fumarylacetoacetate hydrolase domain-containing protein n=1 Tax=Heterostelium pallidum (strain ATCC 26659 / Pp 5 / PN500) TaxID=670386 RepID=D3BSN4_HETP5|nr:Fumarylacetoacetate hydrolase domain-containing protein [Heterostelium album PN500]EFA75499.1 Fumarylacetoacetate hydrolase domain-containing protein [Heterostelium album PN500]|eukprot:XP_020427633.1 Fumarylacetoacetate hydrolase domain-containing protein [Heterostelium album PN500]
MIANVNHSLLKLVTFESLTSGIKSIGALVDNDREVVDFCCDNKVIPNDMKSFIEGGQKTMSYALDIISSGRNRINISNIKLKAPISNPEKVIGIGLNYKEHAIETNMPFPKEPVVFTKFASSIVGPDENIIKPKSTDEVDYEVELVVVIGRECRFVSEANALDYVIGYTVGNDVSARDWQMRKPSGQWSLGTPSGVGFTRKPPVFLNDGNIVDCEIENLGTLTNFVKSE